MLKEKIEANFKQALKEKKEAELSVLKMLKADIINREKEKRYDLSKERTNLNEEEIDKESALTDEEVLSVVISKIKKSRESIAGFEKGGRKEMAEKERKEIEVLQSYLPEQLSGEEAKKMAVEIIEKTGAQDIKDMGKVMSELMPKTKGRIESGLVSRIVKELLS